MRGVLCKATLVGVLAALPGVAQAGWVSEWTNVAVKQNGEHLDPQPSTMAIAGGRVRLEQPDVITLIDYNGGRFTLVNPTKQYFWSGTVDDYVRELSMQREKDFRAQLGGANIKKKSKDGEDKYAPPKIDPAKLPPLSITKTEVKEKVAGYDTVKYEFRTDGDLFQEVWVAPALDVSSELDPGRYLALQTKLGAVMMGKAAGQYNALYFNDEYRKLMEKGFVVKTVTHHIAGSFERTATSVRQADVPSSQFDVPDGYRRVNLSDVLSAPTPSS